MKLGFVRVSEIDSSVSSFVYAGVEINRLSVTENKEFEI